jgi:hypothetical protein
VKVLPVGSLKNSKAALDKPKWYDMSFRFEREVLCPSSTLSSVRNYTIQAMGGGLRTTDMK